ncbi:hypothetical protein Cgig2_003626 [Carnegiea gigantea]|uniref:Uncharacterized protein n=1 Tax=Carnegiea gigantea TaxID=171969 RepID=A0A9Q1QDK2_9CARY|nr:hypothetical protein Cgig2_003626 [Carnegiea gigantea]
MDLAQAHADLQRRDTGVKFYLVEHEFSQSLSALKSMIDIYKLNIIEICWLSSNIEEIIGIVETAANIKELVDVDHVTALSEQDLTCSSKIAHIEGQLNNLSNEVSKVQVKDLIEVESKLKSSLDLKKRETKQDLEKEKDHLKILIGSVISLNNI